MTPKNTTVPLNTQQQAVAAWVREGSGSLILRSRAGTGKTYALLNAVLPPIIEETADEVAGMAFNKSIADEIKAKLAQKAKQDPRYGDWRRLQFGTAHSFGFKAWRKVAPKVRLEDKKVLLLLDRYGEALGGTARAFVTEQAGTIARAVGLAKQAACGYLWHPEDETRWWNLLEQHGLDDELPEDAELSTLIYHAQHVLRLSRDQDHEVIDFNDMLLAPLIHKARFWWKDWVLLDEAQDTNAVRRALALKMLNPRRGRLVAVGDDRQAIYGFTGADSDDLDLIARECRATELALTVTYRCPKAVVREAQRFVPDLEAHPSAPEGEVRAVPVRVKCFLCDGTGQLVDGSICATCRGQKDRPWWELENPEPSKAVVLCRNTKPLVGLAYALLAAGVGCRVEGREIGEGLVKLATRWKRVKGLTPLLEKLEEHQARQVQKWQAKGNEARAQAIEDQCEALRAIAESLLARGETQVEALKTAIRSLFGDTAPGEVPNVLCLSTIHKSKGREWETVYLLDRAGTLPSPWARKPEQVRQEENLEYVAITRAQRALIDLVL